MIDEYDYSTNCHLRVVQTASNRYKLFCCLRAKSLLAGIDLNNGVLSNVKNQNEALDRIKALLLKVSTRQSQELTSYNHILSQLNQVGWDKIRGFHKNIITIEGYHNKEIRVNVDELQKDCSIIDLYQQELERQTDHALRNSLLERMDSLYITSPGPDGNSRYVLLDSRDVQEITCSNGSLVCAVSRNTVDLDAFEPNRHKSELFECGICMSLSPGLPDIYCQNCENRYHYSCVYDWLDTSKDSKRAFGYISGPCIYCTEKIDIKIRSSDM